MRAFLLAFALGLILCAPGQAATIYFAPTAQGAGTGVDCADAYAYNNAT